MNEQEKLSIVKEREELEREIKKHMENIEKAKTQNFSRKKNHQNDLLYQISEKEKLKNKESHDRALEERTAKLLEIEYLKKIEDYKYLQLKKVINFLLVFLFIYFIFLTSFRLKIFERRSCIENESWKFYNYCCY